VPAAVDAVLAVGLAKAAGDRFASAAELAAAITDALSGRVDPQVADHAEALLAALAWGTRLEPAAAPAQATAESPTLS
jgi:hypothetical protein